MNGLPQLFRWFAVVVAGNFLVFPVSAEKATNAAIRAKWVFASTNLPPLPQRLSPVDSFRRLLAMTPRERIDFLSNRPPEIRARILEKVREYLALDPDERELRLRATELRWYLTPLLRDSPTNRDAQLALVPEDLRGLVKSRLQQWEILPPQLQQEFLQNERVLRYFTDMNVTNQLVASDEDRARWNSLSPAERQAITAQFNQFFELTPAEKQKTLNTLSDAERAQMEKTLQTFDKLPPAQRLECIHAFTKFAEMSPRDRAEFLRNAQRWSQLSPKDRQAWRDLVSNVPQWPPVPMENLMPPKMPKIPPHSRHAVVTNLN